MFQRFLWLTLNFSWLFHWNSEGLLWSSHIQHSQQAFVLPPFPDLILSSLAVDQTWLSAVWSANISEQFRQSWMQIIHIHFPLEDEKTCMIPRSICFLISVQMHTSKPLITTDYIFKLTHNMAANFHLQGPFWNDPISKCSPPLVPSDNSLFLPVEASVELIRSSSVCDSHTTTILNTFTWR